MFICTNAHILPPIKTYKGHLDTNSYCYTIIFVSKNAIIILIFWIIKLYKLCHFVIFGLKLLFILLFTFLETSSMFDVGKFKCNVFLFAYSPKIKPETGHHHRHRCFCHNIKMQNSVSTSQFIHIILSYKILTDPLS